MQEELERICFVILLAIFAGVRLHRRSLQLNNESAGGYVVQIGGSIVLVRVLTSHKPATGEALSQLIGTSRGGAVRY